MKNSETEKTLEKYYQALKSGDEAQLKNIVSDNIEVLYHDSSGLLPWGGTWSGFDQFRKFLAIVGENLIIEKVEPMETFVDGSTAVIVLKGRWVSRQTGKALEARVVNIFTVQGSRVARYQVFPDSAGFGLIIGRLAERTENE